LGRIWFGTWVMIDPQESGYVAARVWQDTAWGPELIASSYDSARYTQSSGIACGGGQVWGVMESWFNLYPDAIWATHWNEESGQWEPQMRVSPINGRRCWYGQIAVTREGRPHVVWNELDGYRVLHSYFEGGRWSEPVMVNDSSLGSATWWAWDCLTIDSADNLYVTYNGLWKGDSMCRLFYTRYDGKTWQPQVTVSGGAVSFPTPSAIAARSPSDVWVVWNPNTVTISVSHFDGRAWSPEQRLNDSIPTVAGLPSITLDSTGCPWVVWEGNEFADATSYEIYYNRYLSDLGVARDLHPSYPEPTCVISPIAGSRFVVNYTLPEPARVSLAIYDQLGRRTRELKRGWLPKGNYSAIWDAGAELKAAEGIYFLQLSLGAKELTRKLILVHAK
ncbi:MAG: hypothetical protein ABIK62_03680, partial [candidate division WOR-3 bacterium]